MPLKQLFGRRGDFGELGTVDGLDKGLPAREMSVKRADSDSGVARDRLERHGPPLRGGERRGGHLEQLVAVPARVRPDCVGQSGGSSGAVQSYKRRLLRISPV